MTPQLDPCGGSPREFYRRYSDNLQRARSILGGQPLTLTAKILAAHAVVIDDASWGPGQATMTLQPDRVILQDATAQMSVLQFIQAGREQVAVPTTIHCDHLIRGETGAADDLDRAVTENGEVYDFLRSAACKYGMGFWGPGAGIIHQVVFETYAFPGSLMIGTDSHTPNAGGLGMLAVGVGGADAAEVMGGLPWQVLHPKVIGVRLTGKLSPWASPKDVITFLANQLTVQGGTNCVIEYFGVGATTISATGKATICNMGAELGATCSIFAFDGAMNDYLHATGRADVALLAHRHIENLTADPEVLADPEQYYDTVIDIDLSNLGLYVVGPGSPDRGHALADLGETALANGWPLEPTAVLIGSCTNSSLEDLQAVDHLVGEARRAGLTLKIPLFVSPGSARTLRTAERDGLLMNLREVGATVLANACGPCIGMWRRTDGIDGVNTVVTTFNRNFPGRHDGNSNTLGFITSPTAAVVIAFAGSIGFDPSRDGLVTSSGDTFHFTPPPAFELPIEGYIRSNEGYQAPAEDPSTVEVIVTPDSERLQLLSPFPRWQGNDFEELPVLVKTRGKTTTDHISPAGRWLRFRGHLGRISDNMLAGATNAFTGEIGHGTHPLTGEAGLGLSAIARDLREHGKNFIIIGDQNYGEGSSREHAAMSPRYLGCVTVIARSFARIHQTNLKKQGILPLTFANSDDYDCVTEDCRVSIRGLSDLASGSSIIATVHYSDGTKREIILNHSMTAEQVRWFKAGSALNAAAA